MTAESELLSCKAVQQKLYENLGNREYDCFLSSEEQYIKLKIGFTLFGLPENDEKFNNLNGDYTAQMCYDKEKNEHINKILSVIKSCNVYNENRDQILTSFMFNCCEFPKKKKQNDNDINLKMFPLFRVPKCFGSPTNKNCCFFIDEQSRVYKNWEDYLKNNKIPKAKMYLPKNGKYQGNENDEVLLEVVSSPACGLKNNILKVVDISSTAVSLASGGIAIGTMIPAITVAPIVLAGALLSGAGVGIYSIVRSSLELRDRNAHRQSISLANNEARNCYLNIAAGATSVVTTGATKAASFAVNKGIKFGEGAATALISVNIMNLTVNGCNVANSLCSIASDIINKKNPSSLDILHLATTFLFFGNAVVNFKSAYIIHKESQTKSFAGMVKSQSQNLWSRAKQNFFKTDMTSTDNNSPVKIINNTGDYYSNAVTFSCGEKGIATSQNTVLEILGKFVSEINLEATLNFGLIIIKNIDNVQTLCRIILSRFEFNIQELLLAVLKYLLNDVIAAAYEVLNTIFPNKEILIILLNFVQNFLKFKVTEMEIEYQNKKAEITQDLNISDDEYDANTFRSTRERMTYYFKLCALRMICDNGLPHEIFFREMIRFFWDWLSEEAMNFSLKLSTQQNKEENESINERTLVHCNDCAGYYFTD